MSIKQQCYQIDVSNFVFLMLSFPWFNNIGKTYKMCLYWPCQDKINQDEKERQNAHKNVTHVK